MPMLNEKNACPSAPRNSSLVTLLKSGLNRYSTPAHAFGSMQDATTSTISSTNSAGIIIFEAFSMPSFTPLMMIRCVTIRNVTAQNIGFTGSFSKVLKKSAKNCGSPFSCPAADA